MRELVPITRRDDILALVVCIVAVEVPFGVVEDNF